MTPAEWPICVELLNRGMLQKNPQAEENEHTSTCGTIDPLWIWRLVDVRKAIGISRSSLIKVYPPFCGDGIEIQHCSVTDVALHSAKGSGTQFAEISRWREAIHRVMRIRRASTLFAETVRWTTPPWLAF